MYVGVAILAAVAAVYGLDHWLGSDVGFLFIILAFMGLALTELFNLFERKGPQPFRKLTIVMAAAYVVAHWLRLRGGLDREYESAVVAAFVLLAFAVQGVTRKAEGAVQNISCALFAFLYVPFLGGFVLDLRYLGGGGARGEQAVLAFIMVAKAVDIGAYFTGRRFGRTQMSPIVSPKKTVEGLAGGLICGALVGQIAYFALGWRIAPAWWLAVVSVVIGVAGQLGDLAESMLKRDTGAKDSSVLPGLGGVLDIVDCLLISAPVTYYLLRFGPQA